MKTLNFDEMEMVQGGAISYCDQLYLFLDWSLNGTGDFQGDVDLLVHYIRIYCGIGGE